MEALEIARPFNILNMINFFREIIRGSMMKDGIEVSYRNDRMIVVVCRSYLLPNAHDGT